MLNVLKYGVEVMGMKLNWYCVRVLVKGWFIYIRRRRMLVEINILK